MTEQKTIPEWVKVKQKLNEQRKQDASKFYKFSVGETVITVDMAKPPEEVEKFNKTRFQYHIEVNGEEKILEVGSQLDSLIIRALSDNINPMTVIRLGSGLKTQYSVKELEQ